MKKWRPQLIEAGELILLGVAVYWFDVLGVLFYAIWRLAGRSLLDHPRQIDRDFRNDLEKERLRGTTSGF